ncbi:MAG: branched-chain amino acid ABC transporter substrate-binding protein [Armatimonadetes bacterium]|nr:branched-chain amino acid ABC transporter substrate-binding protein [Armatimonadota bacterium]
MNTKNILFTTLALLSMCATCVWAKESGVILACETYSLRTHLNEGKIDFITVMDLMKQLGIKAKLLAGDGVCSPEFIKLAGDAADILTCSMAGEAVEKLAKGEEFKAKYKAKFNQDVQVYAPYAYDAVYVIADAIKRAGKVDKAAIVAAMPATNYTGVTGQIAFDEKGDIKNGAISMFRVKDGKLEYISTSR